MGAKRIDIEELYFDSTFRDYLDRLCMRNRITYADDFQQSVFTEILDSLPISIDGCKRIARRVAIAEYRSNQGVSFVPFDERIDSLVQSVV